MLKTNIWRFGIIGYGRSLAGAAVLLALFACERNSSKTAVIATSTAVNVLDSVRVSKPTAVLAPAAFSQSAQQEVPDSIGPVTLRARQLSAHQWDSLNADWNDNTRLVMSQIVNLARFRLVQDVSEPPRLFYQASVGDTTWTEIYLALPGSDSEEELNWGAESGISSLDMVNLDGRGAPEVVMRLRPASYGSGSGTARDYVCILDVTSTPISIFRALIATEDEAFGGYAIMHGYKIAPGEQFTGCKRSFKVRRRELVLGPVMTIGKTEAAECTLTKLPAGRYRYQNGKVLRIGK